MDQKNLMISIGITFLAYILNRKMYTQSVSPDGLQYCSHNPPAPFSYRLLRLVLKDNVVAWQHFTGACLVLTGPVFYVFLATRNCQNPLIGVLFYSLLFGVFSVNVFFPVLVDAPAILFILLAAIADPITCLIVTVIAVCIKETSFVFITILTKNLYVLLVGIVAYAIIRVCIKPQKTTAPELLHPFMVATNIHNFTDIGKYVLPWGGGLACLFSPHLDWQFYTLIAVSYAQLLIATDSVRLYQYAFPLVLLHAADSCPIQMLPVAVLSFLLFRRNI